ncbi:MAG: hypothetical protein KGI27_13310 [Thaumarchaeota archaeon]|nr:hypothetical protein [Nitrososphaerota archaeon]
MNFSKKFYDIGVAEAGGGTETLEETAPAAVEKQETKQPEKLPVEENMSPAAIMAKQGVKITSGSLAQKEPEANKETKEAPPKAEEAEPVATTNEAPKAEKAKPESQSPKQEAPKAQNPPIEAKAEVAPPSWKEVLKSQQPNDVLKELGFDDKTVQIANKLKGFEKIDFFNNLIDEWQKKGDLKSYLQELTTDYSKMPPEEVMRHQLREEYPKASEAQLNVLFKNEVIKAFKLDSDDPDEVAEGQLLLEAKADKHRDSLIDRQKTKLFPEVPPPPEPEPDLQAEKAQQEFESYKAQVKNDEFTKDVFDKKRIIVGTGRTKFNYPVDPEKIEGVLFDTDKWLETQFNIDKNPDGTVKTAIPKTRNQILTAAFALDPDNFLKEYAKHYESLGSEKAIESIDNAKRANMQTINIPESVPKDPAAAMAKMGRKVPGGV